MEERKIISQAKKIWEEIPDRKKIYPCDDCGCVSESGIYNSVDDGERYICDLCMKDRQEDAPARDYIMPFGKYKGMRLSQIGIADLEIYCTWLQDNTKAHGVIEKIRAYFNEPKYNPNL